MANLIDNLIEGWAKKRAASVRQNPDTPVEGLENFSLEESPPATPLEAAHAVREAVAAKTGRRPTLAYWKPVAAKSLGISKLFAKRWQGVIDAGIDAGLFRIDTEALAHPILVALDPEPEPAPEEVEHIVKTRAVAQDKDDFDYNAPWPPPGYVSPVTYRCGHTNHRGHGVTEDDPKQVAAREAGHCCTAMQRAVEDAETSQWNRGPTIHVHWRVRGLWDPLPKVLHRTSEKDGGPGFPGLCADPATGFYIGGLGNNCRHYHPGTERCVVHRSKYAKEA